MSNRWRGVVVAARDPARLSRWWAEVLGYRILTERGDEVAVGPADDQPLLSFARSSTTAATNPGRVRLEIRVDDRDAELERLVDMGARPVAGAEPWVLTDPEGNEFAVSTRTAVLPT